MVKAESKSAAIKHETQGGDYFFKKESDTADMGAEVKGFFNGGAVRNESTEQHFFNYHGSKPEMPQKHNDPGIKVSRKTGIRGSNPKISKLNSPTIQRSPDVGFQVNSLTRMTGELDNPMDDAGQITFPLSFGVDSPISSDANVTVTGVAGDPCGSYQIGYLQTVHSQWLTMYYWGRSRGHGHVEVRGQVGLPVRDGPTSTFWYADSAHQGISACGDTATPHMDDYPTIFAIPKMENNTLTGQPNYLTGVIRGIHFVTFLVATDGTRFFPLRHFYWNYWMDIRFRPNYGDINAVWPYTWRINRANAGGIIRGGSSAITMFTTATTPYNHALRQLAYEFS